MITEAALDFIYGSRSPSGCFFIKNPRRDGGDVAKTTMPPLKPRHSVAGVKAGQAWRLFNPMLQPIRAQAAAEGNLIPLSRRAGAWIGGLKAHGQAHRMAGIKPPRGKIEEITPLEP